MSRARCVAAWRLMFHPPCGCGVAVVRAWIVDRYGILECLLCRATWVEVEP